MTVTSIEYHLRSLDETWCYAKWEQLPDDGNRYDVIEGVLYMSNAPSFDHQWVILALVEHLGLPLEHAGTAIAAFAPIGVIMLGPTRSSRSSASCDPNGPASLARAASAVSST